MKTFNPFGPSLGKGKLSKKFIKCINYEIDKLTINKKNDYSAKLASQIKNEIKLSNTFVEKNLSKELILNIKKYLIKSKSNRIKKIKIINLWIIRQFKNEYNPVHYHEGQLSGVGYLKIPKFMTKNKHVRNKKIKTNGTIDFINGQKNFLSKSIYNLNPKIGDLVMFPNYLMHTAYPFNVDGERRSFSFNVKIIFKKK
ncbi:2OG-Fe(II) oxygenase family protein [Pelagibacteraceae bacterium]|nr:2OG-Fe(II) oxygenase family protein [Candidatus Pelagibacter sp.]MDC1485499.1 2OG-Fe(II) oxygenase family protein [Pelagibacteraceae bacterium]